ncbi:MAG: 50S ribosomal protein L3 [Dehalococcoidia bacterium]|nr:50S ribosomal protein L3 [Dehalococcoidia bacterium]MDZ4247477.1 50S ribosomal protein L3 [Dehalococcoidia bacterium]
MIRGILGKKIGMTRVIGESGVFDTVTVIEAGPCVAVQIKNKEKDGYSAVQLGFGQAKKLNAAAKGHLKGLGSFRYLREVEMDSSGTPEVGQVFDVSIFEVGSRVDIVGVTKGKGFAGVVKRHHFAGGPKTHGQSDRWRAPGSIGAGTSPGRVWKGQKMAGHMGHDALTQRNLKVILTDPQKQLLLVRGAVPGAKNDVVLIKQSKWEKS